MREVVEQVRQWHRDEVPFALATVVAVHGSAPRPPGASMAVATNGDVVGSVSGGCVEGAVYEVATEVLRTGAPALETFGISDETAFDVGLTCGGSLDVLIHRVLPGPAPVAAAASSIAAGEPTALATVVGGDGELGAQLAVWPDRAQGTLSVEGLDVAVTADARGMLAQGQSGTRHYGASGERRREEVSVFIDCYTTPPRMLVFGAIDFAAAVARLGRYLGYHVTVCDARPVFATAKRFPDADEVVCEWPHHFLERTRVDERTVMAVLTHDPKFDVPLLQVALRTPARYIGAMGSRRTDEERRASLRELGVTEEQLARLRSPIGLDLGARTPEETAVSIAAEIISAQWGGSGVPLADASGEIHHAAPGSPA